MKPLNEELITLVFERIEADPAGWDQGDFFKKSKDSACGTSACFAGHALLASGYTLTLERREIKLDNEEMFSLEEIVIRRPDGQVTANYDGEAAELLGFDDREMDRVFYSTQNVNIDQLKDVIEDVRERRLRNS